MRGAADADDLDEAPDVMLRTAERHASMRVPITSAGEQVSALLVRLQGHQFDSASVAAVCDGELLVGLAS